MRSVHKAPRLGSVSYAFLAIIAAVTSSSIHAQTWRPFSGGLWSEPANWGGTVPTSDGSANITFSQIGDRTILRGATTMDRNWNTGFASRLTLSAPNVLTGPNSLLIGQTGTGVGDARFGTEVLLNQPNDYTGGTHVVAGRYFPRSG
jgi:hypothetical protein